MLLIHERETFSPRGKRKTPHCAVETNPSNRIETSGTHPEASDFLFIKARRPPALGYRSVYIALRSEDFVSIHEHGRVKSLSTPRFSMSELSPRFPAERIPTAGANYRGGGKYFQAKIALPFSWPRTQRNGGNSLERGRGRESGQSKQGGWLVERGFCPSGELGKRSNQS